MKQITLLFTPGLDSFIANKIILKNLKEDEKLTRVYFDLGHRYADYEVDFLRIWYEKDYFDVCKNIYLGNLEKDNAYIPNRNLIIATCAQSIYNSDVIYLNGVKDDRVSDNDKRFRELASSVLSKTAQKEVEVLSPFAEYEKSEIVKWYADDCYTQNELLEILEKTFSCYDEDLYEELDMPYFKKINDEDYEELGKTNVYGCMSCPACYRRMSALTAANLFVPFYDFSIIKKYYLDKSISEQDFPNRVKTIREYFKFMDWFGCD